jgi:hypothetical protein
MALGFMVAIGIGMKRSKKCFVIHFKSQSLLIGPNPTSRNGRHEFDMVFPLSSVGDELELSPKQGGEQETEEEQ